MIRRPADIATIVIGAHRSGTSLVARTLERMGLFLGRAKDENAEATFFIRLNDWILRQVGGAWDNPAAIERLLLQPDVRRLTSEYLAASIVAPRSIHYWGLRRFLRLRRSGREVGPWGWKDPRNSLTLPLWLDVVGTARVIHVRRHGVDVAASLWRRAESRLNLASGRHQTRLHLGYGIRGKRHGFVDSVRCLDLEGAFSLWEQYECAAQRHLRDPRVTGISIAYEDLLLNPRGSMQALAAFCALGRRGNWTPRGAEAIDPNRAFAFRRDPVLVEFSHHVTERLRALGYDA